MHTISLVLPRFEIALGPCDQSYLAGLLRSVSEAPVDITFEYTPPVAGAAYLANGDPGDEPPEQEDLTITNVTNPEKIHFLAWDDCAAATLLDGCSLLDYMTVDAVIKLELEVLKIVRDAPGEARLDNYLAGLP